MSRARIFVAAPLLLILGVIEWRLLGPAPKPAYSPLSEYSAETAVVITKMLLPENAPHPTGSAANARVRDRIVARLRELGYQPRVQRRFACNAAALCATVDNVFAGDLTRDAVVVSAHYDSVPSGPGASDDLSAVGAMLEVARALRGKHFRNPIVFLATDGEELGLLGAEAFIADEQLSRHAAVFVNVEHRGTSGPSFLFETSRRNRWLVRHAARVLEQPLTSSLFATIYDLMPNDTDLTVFKRAGRAGVNFGAVGDVNWYHTPLDDVHHLDPRTNQHQGQNMLALTRELADADLAARSPDDAVFFDILGITIVGWPAPWTIWIALISLAVLIVGVRKSNPRAITLAVLAAFATLIVAALAGWLLATVSQLRAHGLAWTAMPQAAVVAMWLTGIAAALLPWRGKTHHHGLAMVFHAAAIVLAMTLPGLSHVFLVPAIVLSLCAVANVSPLTTSIAATCTAAILLFPISTMLYVALGRAALPVIAVLLTIVMMLAAPSIASLRAAAIVFALAAVCALVSTAMPAATPERPSRLMLTYLDDPAHPPLWLSNSAPPTLRQVATFEDAPLSLSPWTPYPARWQAAAPKVELPRVEVSRDGNMIHVRSRRNAQRVTLAFRSSAPVRGVRVNGLMPPPRPPRFSDWLAPNWHYVDVNGSAMDVEIRTDPNARIEAIASDMTYGLPPAGAALVAARTAANAITSHDGDMTVTRARLSP
jgi:hypothetical protein